MSKADIAIIVVAKNISPRIINRFRNSVSESKPDYSYQIILGTSDEKVFFKTKILNGMLRKCLDNYKLIIQTDIDLIIPPELINHTFETINQKDKVAYHHVLRYVDFPHEVKRYSQYPFKEWRGVKPKFCSGCWNAMTSNSWRLSKGYNEEMSAWGYEDTEFYHRAMRLGIEWLKMDRYPLVHINHEKRQPDRVKENTKRGNLFSDESDWLKGKIIKK